MSQADTQKLSHGWPDPSAEPARTGSSPTTATPVPADVPAAEREPATDTDQRRPILAWLVRVLPTWIVFAVLGGLGAWGHHAGWKIPKFSELTGAGATETIAWCDEHGVPEADCIACNADLMPKGKLHGWCKEHGVAECVLHHPEVAQLQQAAVVLPADLDRAARALALKPRAKNDPTCKLHLRRIQLTSAAAVEKAGIDIDLVDRAAIVETVTANGEVRYDPTLVARLSSRASGIVWRVDKNVGDSVRQGEVLALVDAAEVGRVKAELLQAAVQLQLQTKTYQRLAKLGSVVAGRRVLESEAARAEARAAVGKAIQALVNLGMPITLDEVRNSSGDQLTGKIQLLGLPDEIVAGLDPQRTTSNLIAVTAPRDGIVVRRDVVAGEVVDWSRTLLTIADTRRMWLLLQVPLEEAKYIAQGQRVDFRPDGGDHDDTGTITWISTAVDAKTRTVMVRAELPNRDGHLRNETFGVGNILLREEPDAIVVPNEAVHWEGCCHVVFVRDKGFLRKGSYKVFHTRMVRPGVTNGDLTEMIAGVLPGEVVVTTGGGALRAELLKGNLGAG